METSNRYSKFVKQEKEKNKSLDNIGIFKQMMVHNNIVSGRVLDAETVTISPR